MANVRKFYDFSYLCNVETVTNNICKSVASLDERKHRRREGAFKSEGSKCVLDTLGHFSLRAIYAIQEWMDEHPDIARLPQAVTAGRGDLRKMSSLTTPGQVIAVYDIPERTFSPAETSGSLMLALDTIQDPGNLGTIIRVADWYGITDILASRETADCFAPKVIQATMGSISRVAVHYCDLPATLSALDNVKIYGTFLDGDDIDTVTLSPQGIIVIGNEGNGISDPVASLVTDRITLPSWPAGRPTGESLNAAIATAITVSKFRAGR